LVVERVVTGRAGAMRATGPSTPPHVHTPAPGRATGGPRRVFFAAVANCKKCVSSGAPAARLWPTTRTRRRLIAARANFPLCR
jgi:hypothetical protein